MAKILIVEDDLDLRSIVEDWLKHEHHTVECATKGDEALDLLKVYPYDLIILDWELPNLSGIEILKAFRGCGGRTPILMLTGKGELDNKETGLDTGADDYLTKPFHMKELSARIRALLRRPASAVENVLKVGDLTLNPKTYAVTKGGADIKLLPKEFALLEFFMRYPNQVFSAEALLDRVWRSESDVAPETVRTCIKRLRKKLNAESEDSIIQTLHGVGYKLYNPD
ncbi:MAG TPA: response regulator transcription factor [Candidatus Obscuribacterales bacterium]